MAARPRTVSDEDLMNATLRIMSRLGPVKLTLAAIAKEAGVTAATLVQRFGSKRGLMLRMSSDAAASADACFDMVRAAHPGSPLAAIVAAATMMTQHMGTPEELANSLAFLQIDISDPEFHSFTLEMSKKHLAGYKALLKDAIAAGELKPHDTTRMARAINAMSGGSLIAWAILREGTAERWVRRDIETLLSPYRTQRLATRRRRSRAEDGEWQRAGELKVGRARSQ